MPDQLLLLFLLEVRMFHLAQLQLLVEVARQVLYFFNLRPHLHLHHHQLPNPDIDALLRISVPVEILEALADLAVLHIVKLVHPLHQLADPDGYLGEKALRGELFELFVLDPSDEQVLLYIGEGVLEVIREVVPEELLEEEGLDPRKDVDATLLAIEGLELGVVTRLVSLLLHQHQCSCLVN